MLDNWRKWGNHGKLIEAALLVGGQGLKNLGGGGKLGRS